MKLTTDILPRRDGTLTATTAAGKEYAFLPGDDGRLYADVPDEGDIGFLLDTGNFYPADENDIQKGLAIAAPPGESGGEDKPVGKTKKSVKAVK